MPALATKPAIARAEGPATSHCNAFEYLAKILGLLLTLFCWYATRKISQHNQWTSFVLIVAAPLFQYPIASIGLRRLDATPLKTRAERTSIFVHYAMMIVLGASIFPAIDVLLAHAPKHGSLVQLIIGIAGQVLMWTTGIAAALSVLNLAIRGLGAPFAAKLSSRLATDWMYAWTRNPMGLCTFAFLLSLAIRFQSPWFAAWLIVVITPGWIFFVRVYEERELEIRFGESYVQYRENTPFLWPRGPTRNRQHAQNLKAEEAEKTHCDRGHVRR